MSNNSNALTGAGTKFQRMEEDSSPAEFKTIAEVRSISGPDKSRDTVEVTPLDTDDGYRKFIASVRDSGSVSLTMNFTRDGYETINDDFEDDEEKNYQIVLPDDEETTLEFEGLVTELPLDITLDDAITADVTIKVTGKVDITYNT